ncbi:unnamed protein product [Blepharisma stoltei]|uniref:HIT domain-containing protein n=1 Tax=Blepharisma stoltei TaxID=1481888 RepID=A0AAU9J1P8_9CILI|nr:unnamed protein product [Blepharisma stoltei]
MEVSQISLDLLIHSTSLTNVYLCPTPVLPGHILIAPKSRVRNLFQLSEDETSDLFRIILRINNILENEYQCSSLTLDLKDGVYNHLFFSLIPRKFNDLEENDEIYSLLEKMELVQENSGLNQKAEELRKIMIHCEA